MCVSVVFEHTGIQDVDVLFLFEAAVAVFECAGDLKRTVAPEVEEYDAVAVVYRADGLAVLCDYKGRKILIDFPGFCAVRLYCVGCGVEKASFAAYMRVPAFFNHLPVGFVSVHGDDHSAAAGSDTCVKAGIVQ